MNISKRTLMITKITLMTAFLIVASYIVIPMPFAVASISLQTLAVNLIALLLSPLEAGIAIVVYILLCAAGVPVANGGKGGLTYLLGPTGGFFIGFLVAVVLISLLKGKMYSIPRYLLTTIGIGIPVMYLFAMIWMVAVTGLPLKAAFLTGCAPFLPLDAVKCVVASLMARPLVKVMNQYEQNNGITKETI